MRWVCVVKGNVGICFRESTACSGCGLGDPAGDPVNDPVGDPDGDPACMRVKSMIAAAGKRDAGITCCCRFVLCDLSL